MTSNSEIEFLEWDTPFKNTRNGILEATYVGSNSSETDKNWDLKIRIHDYDNDKNYSIFFDNISGFRILDEHGLVDLWTVGSNRPAQSTFKVRNHSWHKESPATFFFGSHPDGEYSFVISTDWDCAEVVCKNTPRIETE